MNTEDQNTEFKKEYTDSITKTIVAFSNSKGGTIEIGVDDDGNIIGVEDPDNTCLRCVQIIRDKIRPDISTTSKVEITDMEDKKIVLVTVKEGPKKPYYIREKGLRPESVFVREGTSSIPITDDGFYQLVTTVKSPTYETLISFDQKLTFDFLRDEFKKKKMKLDANNMESLRITKNGEYTNLGYLLSDQFDQPIKIAAFSDDCKSEFIDRDILSGSVLKQMKDAFAFINKHNRLSSKIVGMEREDRYAYPHDVIREAIVNTIVHRDYCLDASTLISIFPDKITFVSPGGLFTPFTTNELFSGVSSLRNKNLAGILYRLKYIEAYGTGLPRIKKSYSSCESTPQIETGASTFKISIPAMDVKTSNKIDRYFSEPKEFTRNDVQKELGLKKSDAISEINNQLLRKKIEKIGFGRSTRYRTV